MRSINFGLSLPPLIVLLGTHHFSEQEILLDLHDMFELPKSSF